MVVMLAMHLLVEMCFDFVFPVNNLHMPYWNISNVAIHEPSVFAVEFEGHQSSNDYNDSARVMKQFFS